MDLKATQNDNRNQQLHNLSLQIALPDKELFKLDNWLSNFKPSSIKN